MTRNSPSRLDVGFVTLKSDANAKSRQHEHNGSDQETVHICWQVSRNDYVQNNRPQLRQQSGNQARLLKGPIAIHERSKVTYHHIPTTLFSPAFPFQVRETDQCLSNSCACSWNSKLVSHPFRQTDVREWFEVAKHSMLRIGPSDLRSRQKLVCFLCICRRTSDWKFGLDVTNPAWLFNSFVTYFIDWLFRASQRMATKPTMLLSDARLHTPCESLLCHWSTRIGFRYRRHVQPDWASTAMKTKNKKTSRCLPNNSTVSSKQITKGIMAENTSWGNASGRLAKKVIK